MSMNSRNSLGTPNALDFLLIGLGIVGLVMYFLVLPANHPDTSAAYSINDSEAVERAEGFLVRQGYSIGRLTAAAHLTRHSLLLNHLQADHGRKEAIRILKNDENGILPAYLWSVSFRSSDLPTGSVFSFGGAPEIFRIMLNQSGDVVEFENHIDNAGALSQSLGDPTQSLNRGVLSTLFTAHDSLRSADFARLNALSDSTLFASLYFDKAGVSDDRMSSDRISALESDRSVGLDSLDILHLAHILAPENAIAHTSWVVDSLHIFQGSPERLAYVRLRTEQPIHDQELRVDMTISSTGNLQEMNVVVNPGRILDDTLAELLGVVKFGAYFLIAIVLIIYFIRRMVARLVDVKGAMIDALAFGVLVGIVAVLSSQIAGNEALSRISLLVGGLLAFSFAGGASALAVFIFSGGTESLTREIFPEKLVSGILLRKGDVRNRVVGWSIIRGLSVAGLLLGIGVLSLALLPDLSLELTSDLTAEKAFSPVLSNFAISTSFSYLILVLLILGLGSFAYRLVGQSWFVFIVIALVGAFLGVEPFGFEVGWLSIGVSGAVAIVLAFTYVRYDFLTALIGFFVATFAWSLSEAFLVAQSPALLDMLLAGFFVVAFGSLGLVGTFSKRSEGNVHEYVPEYITEMAGQERVKRELEIAYQVQASFLPRTMPTVEGLDLAGMCLPASEVGGDYFDFIQLPGGKLAFVVGDVSGKGIEAAFYMTLVKGVVQTLSTHIFSPSDVMQRLNAVFRRNAPAGTFISAIYGVVDPSTGEFTFARAGHNPGILKRADQNQPEYLRPNGMAVGFSDGKVFSDSMSEACITIKSGDTLVFYTDGFSEAMNSKRELYGDDRLLDKVGQVGDRTAGGILRALTEDVHHFIEGAGRSDDMTMIVVKATR